jgi:hypothetical protein
LGTELLKYGISQDLIDEEFFFIQNLLGGNHREEEEEILRNHPVIDVDRRGDEELQVRFSYSIQAVHKIVQWKRESRYPIVHSHYYFAFPDHKTTPVALIAGCK